MNKYVFLPSVLLLFISCKMITNSDKQFGIVDENKIYRLRLNPAAGSKYFYDISNQSEIKLEVNSTKIDNINKTTVGVSYAVSKDSLGNFLINMQYDKIKIYSKTADTETEMDADNAALTSNPVEKMLGILKTASITATVSPAGEVKSVTGYKELTAKVLEKLAATDTYARTTAQTQWEQFVEKGFVKTNLDQLFKIFPDSAVHIGDKWKLNIEQSAELGLMAKSSFLLKEINNDVAVIISTGEIKSDSTPANLMGQVVTANLKGRQEGEYEMNIRTGMLIKSNITATVEGTIQMMGREIPVKVKSAINMNGKKLD